MVHCNATAKDSVLEVGWQQAARFPICQLIFLCTPPSHSPPLPPVDHTLLSLTTACARTSLELQEERHPLVGTEAATAAALSQPAGLAQGWPA